MAQNNMQNTASDQRRGTISVCMMVKNEEKRLPTALGSVKDWVDEIIVVDTGSTDSTIQIAESFGAKIYHHPWEYDFAKHRNQSIQYATGDWIFILDADEELEQDSGFMLHKLVTNPPTNIHCFLFELHNTMPHGGTTYLMHPRLFRNHIGFHYEGKVHNRPMLTGQGASTKIKLMHYGYNEDEQTMEAKHERRILMIRKWVEEEPDNYNARGYLAHTLQTKKETLKESIEQALTGLELLSVKSLEDQSRYAPHLYYPLLNSLTTLNRDDELIEYADKCIKVAPNYPDSYFFKCWVYYKRKQWQELYECAKKFLELQKECKLHPEQFIYYENLSAGQINNVRIRLVVACALLGKEDEALQHFKDIFDDEEPEVASKITVQSVLSENFAKLARDMTAVAMERRPQWAWPLNMMSLVERKSLEQDANKGKEHGLSLLEQGRFSEAREYLQTALAIQPNNEQILLGLAKTMLADKQPEEATAFLVSGLNAHPGHPWAWQTLADYYYEKGRYWSSAACYKRLLSMTDRNPQAAQRLEDSLAHISAQPRVSQQPPKLLMFMVNGLSYQLLQQPAPHFLMGKAWGEFLTIGYEDKIDPLWASLLTGANPMVHGISQDNSFHSHKVLSLKDSNVPSVWELLAPELKVGFVAAPLAHPSLATGGWYLPGYPCGLLKPDNVQPMDLIGVPLANGYRSDFLLGAFEEEILSSLLTGNVIQEAFMMQQERNKLTTAMNMPAVDVLVIGFNALEYYQRVHGMPQYSTFNAYQQVYAWIEATLAALQPENFAVFSQRGATGEMNVHKGGTYVLSWLKGENGQAHVTDIAGVLLDLLGGNRADLGKMRV